MNKNSRIRLFIQNEKGDLSKMKMCAVLAFLLSCVVLVPGV